MYFTNFPINLHWLELHKTMSTATRKIDQLLSEYGESHKNKVNKSIHWICIPLIFFSIFGLIRCIPTPAFFDQIPYLNWASIVLVLSLIYYLTLSFPLFLGFLVWSGIVILGNEYLYNEGGATFLLIFSIIVFVLAWIGQFIGHDIEGKKPSFLKDLQFLLIGPAWLMHFILKKLGLKY